MACSEEWWAEEDSEDDCAESERLRKAAAAATVRRRVVADLLPFLCHDGRGPQGKKRPREDTPFTWDAHLLLLTEDEFKRPQGLKIVVRFFTPKIGFKGYENAKDPGKKRT